MTTKAQQAQADRDEARAELRAMLKPGDVVQVLQRSVSRSGMTRHLSLYVTRDGELTHITTLAARAMGETVSRQHGMPTLKVTGCGMDMHFATVYNLSRSLFPSGHKCTGSDGTSKRGRRCPSNDHSNDYGTAQRAYYAELEASGGERIYSGPGSDEQHAAMRAYVEQRLTTDLGYSRKRTHSDGGYALTHRTI